MRETFLSRQRQSQLTTTRRNFLRACGLTGLSLLPGCHSTRKNAELETVSLPGRHSVQADQLVLLSDFRIDYNHEVIADLKELRGDVLDVLDNEPTQLTVTLDDLTISESDGVAAGAQADQRRIRAGYLLGMFAGLFGMLGGFAALLTGITMHKTWMTTAAAALALL